MSMATRMATHMTHQQLKDFYNNCRHDPLLDYLTNAEYLTHISEPRYAIILALIKTVSYDILRYILQYTSEPETNLSERTTRRLARSISNGNFTNFKFIYDNEYMKPTIMDWFEFDEPVYDSVGNFYALCNCITCDPIRINRYISVQPCSCENGKQYLAFKLVQCEFPKYNSPEQQMLNYIIASGPILRYHTLIKYTF